MNHLQPISTEKKDLFCTAYSQKLFRQFKNNDTLDFSSDMDLDISLKTNTDIDTSDDSNFDKVGKSTKKRSNNKPRKMTKEEKAKEKKRKTKEKKGKRKEKKEKRKEKTKKNETNLSIHPTQMKGKKMRHMKPDNPTIRDIFISPKTSPTNSCILVSHRTVSTPSKHKDEQSTVPLEDPDHENRISSESLQAIATITDHDQAIEEILDQMRRRVAVQQILRHCEEKSHPTNTVSTKMSSYETHPTYGTSHTVHTTSFPSRLSSQSQSQSHSHSQRKPQPQPQSQSQSQSQYQYQQQSFEHVRISSSYNTDVTSNSNSNSHSNSNFHSHFASTQSLPNRPNDKQHIPIARQDDLEVSTTIIPLTVQKTKLIRPPIYLSESVIQNKMSQATEKKLAQYRLEREEELARACEYRFDINPRSQEIIEKLQPFSSVSAALSGVPVAVLSQFHEKEQKQREERAKKKEEKRNRMYQEKLERKKLLGQEDPRFPRVPPWQGMNTDVDMDVVGLGVGIDTSNDSQNQPISLEKYVERDLLAAKKKYQQVQQAKQEKAEIEAQLFGYGTENTPVQRHFVAKSDKLMNSNSLLKDTEPSDVFSDRNSLSSSSSKHTKASIITETKPFSFLTEQRIESKNQRSYSKVHLDAGVSTRTTGIV